MKNRIIYYNRDDQNRPIVTVCLMKYGEDWARGVAVCNLKYDKPSKKIGRKIASNRAANAIRTRKSHPSRANVTGYGNNQTPHAFLSSYEEELVKRVNGKDQVQSIETEDLPKLSA